MDRLSKVGSKYDLGLAIQGFITIYGYGRQLSQDGLVYIKPRLPETFTDEQRAQYARKIASTFSVLAKREPAEVGFWTQRGLQIQLYKEAIANGNYRILEKDGNIAAILLFRAYKKGSEAEASAINLVNEAADFRYIGTDAFTEFLKAFCDEMKQELGARLIISRKRKGETLLSRILLSVGFREVEADKEPVQDKSGQTSNLYAIYKKELV